MWLWIIQNVLGEIPLMIWPAIAGAAAAVVVFFKVIGKLPQFKMFAYLIKPVAFASFVAALFLWGGAGVNAIYMDQIREMQEKVTAAEAAAAEANEKLAEKLAEKAQVVREVHTVYKTRVQEIATRIDAECKVDKDAISNLNTIAKGEKEQ